MIAGFCWPQSAAADEKVTLYCHTDGARIAVEIVRQGARDSVVATLGPFAGQRQGLVEDTAEGPLITGPGEWRPTAEITVAPDWPSGFYLVRLTDEEGGSAEAFFVVRARERGQATLVLSTSTWSAYNDWGAPSFYTGAHRVATQRPLPRGFLAKADPARFRVARHIDWQPADARDFADAGYSMWCMAAGWANWELLFVRWAEAEGWSLNYATSADLDREGDLLDACPAYLSVGHDEYWSAGMRDAVEHYVEQGGNAAFFSGNTAFWHARFEENYGQLVCYKTDFAEDPVYQAGREAETATMWSDPLLGRPENEMTGVSFTRGGYAHMRHAPRGTGGYVVHRPEHWAFAGLGLARGELLGAEAIVVGYECDGCDLALEGELPAATGVDGTAADFTVLGTADAKLWETHEVPGNLHGGYVGELNWVAERIGGADSAGNRARFGRGHAVLGAFGKGRGEVFTTGCTDWAYGLGRSDVAAVTRNVMERFVNRKGGDGCS